MTARPAIDGLHLHARLAALARIGAIDGGGCARLALTDEDKHGRDLVVSWMRALDLAITVDAIGNVFGVRRGREDGPPVMTGSHIDTVRTGGRFDGNYGVLAGLEVCRALDTVGVRTRHPLCVAFFTNEEGARFQPDMMGSLVHAGGFSLQEAYAATDTAGVRLGDELERIGYRGPAPTGAIRPRAFIELHIEQGPILEDAAITIGAVTGVQGISWYEFIVTGVSAHAGTTPMRLRHDAGYVAAAAASFVRQVARDMGGAQVGTVGVAELRPNLINVIANHARFTVDLRNTDEALLQEAERRVFAFIDDTAQAEGVTIERRRLARLEPVVFDTTMVDRVERIAQAHGRSTLRLPSGAGHDAQMMARLCPTSMIFVPSVKGLSHNVAEYTTPADLEAGAAVLLDVMLELAED
ncbi:Zn-dependent hydrolase [Reyranella sp. CPCC 100927]|uniref:Zn-dependent hydrolase n=1 Tax=Reyranella sp. CPCC 100927 TaxID=2599616 RepID=UPI0011B685D1|nr:Zn-dependent hydrolase [Reyranella sp. CPCC 100927]TWT05978.1 Zn-dependent hydrolase [Reyranella sp. CPCC 100927]